MVVYRERKLLLENSGLFDYNFIKVVEIVFVVFF